MLKAGGFRGAIASEWRKVRRQKFPLIALGMVVLATVASRHWVLEKEDVNGFYWLCGTARHGFTAAGFLVLLYAATTIAGEATTGTLKLVLVRAVGRIRFILAKALFLLILTLALALAVTVTAWLVGHAEGGYGNVMEEGLSGQIAKIDADLVGNKPFVAAALTVLPLLAFAALGLLISCLTSSSTTAVTVAVLTYPILLVLPTLVSGAAMDSGGYLFSHHMKYALDLAAKWSQGHAEGWDFGMLATGLVVPPMYTLVLLGAALTIFSRKDIAL
jgi:ABC-2 type transport system permease protein